MRKKANFSNHELTRIFLSTDYTDYTDKRLFRGKEDFKNCSTTDYTNSRKEGVTKEKGEGWEKGSRLGGIWFLKIIKINFPFFPVYHFPLLTPKIREIRGKERRER